MSATPFFAVLIRELYQTEQTLGTLKFYKKSQLIFECKTLELPWNNNANQISCIPEGYHICKAHESPTYGKCLKLCEVDADEIYGRSNILMHPLNFFTQTKGCIGVGIGYKFLNTDKVIDITHSKITLANILLAVGSIKSFPFLIISAVK